jgi:hypothetical protein
MKQYDDLVKKWRKLSLPAVGISEYYTGIKVQARQCADELSALLSQHAAAEPPHRACRQAEAALLDKISELARAAEQPKLTEGLSFETWWGWFKGGLGETGAREEDIARSAWIQSRAVQRALLTSPVAPRPQVTVSRGAPAGVAPPSWTKPAWDEGAFHRAQLAESFVPDDSYVLQHAPTMTTCVGCGTTYPIGNVHHCPTHVRRERT